MLQRCKAMEQDLANYDRSPLGNVGKSYEHLLCQARAALEVNRSRWFRDELSLSIGGGWVNPSEKGVKGRGNGE